MGDYSPHVLERARAEVRRHGDHVCGLVLEATRLSGTVGFLAGKAFGVYISNVYDNLPTDEVAVIRGFDVRFSPFRQRPDAHVQTLTAQVRE